jgi:hypothetical protein
MHVHANQINPNLQLNPTYSAERTAAQREAANTRKKLLDSASQAAGEADAEEACIVSLCEREEPKDNRRRQNLPRQSKPAKRNQPADSDDADTSISDWA